MLHKTIIIFIAIIIILGNRAILQLYQGCKKKLTSNLKLAKEISAQFNVRVSTNSRAGHRFCFFLLFHDNNFYTDSPDIVK